MHLKSVEDKGVLYIVSSVNRSEYVDSAIESAKSVKRHNENLKIHIYINEEWLPTIKKHDYLFDSHGIVDINHSRSKVDYIGKSPFANTLYLDSDTRVVANIEEMFLLLNRYDIALSHAHNRSYHFKNTDNRSPSWINKFPEAYPQFNGGVLLFRRNKAIDNLMTDWGNQYHAQGFEKDQITLRQLIWDSKLDIYILPPEYNIRNKKYLDLWKSGKEATPKILHLRDYHNINNRSKIEKLLYKLIRHEK